MRKATLPLLSAALVLGLALPASADPGNGNGTAWEPIQDFMCDFGEGFVPVEAVGTGAAAHVIGSNSIGVLQTATIEIFVNDVLSETVEVVNPGRGLDLTHCTWTPFDYVDENGDHIRAEGDGWVQFTPRGGGS